MFGPHRPASRGLALFIAVLPLCGCHYDPAPSDFEPQPPASPTWSGDRCPDLDGLVVDLAGDPLAAALAERAPPDAHGLPMRLAIRRGVTHQELWWVVPREDLLAFARDLRDRSPQRYAEWRSLLLRGTLEGSRSWDHEGWLAAVAAIGPPGPVHAGIVGYRCEDHWASARDQGMQYADGATTERELWLARDRSGDLLLRDATVRMKPFSVWGDSTGHWRTGVSSTWRRIPALASVSTAKLTEEELPLPLRRDGTLAATPGETGRSCADAPQRLVALSQRLLATLPRGIEVVRFMPRQAPAGGPRDCTLLEVEVTFDGPSPQALEAVDAIVRQGDDVRSVDQLLLADGESKPRRALTITLQ